ncbi:hypothetical protein CONPUDRAFT_74451 [Coniophora puteana RWD-64-598 SS2]|uniref:Uncharacterized protein n=1 Tax=Coniophora puteana (strain RWD-64-598) TaxID=741705 RepID=A0A5M3MIE0_CONPW|nr:uncharacterized protein CONPUDRAFT_74451 [Coniophora puteana RWD-64-598 SS2]EIW78863.1 hypothetical protein CONPUDRAFT_74451 [Coniophora puteana RWD-64-598 SS2]
MYDPGLAAWAREYVTQEYIGFLAFTDEASGVDMGETYIVWHTNLLSYQPFAVSRFHQHNPGVHDDYQWRASIGPPERASIAACFALWSSREVFSLILTAVLQGMMTLRAYALLGRSKPFLYVMSALFVVVQGTSITSNLFMFGAVFKSTSRTNISGFNVCDTGAPSSLSWITPTSNTLWMTYETILCGAVLRYAFKEIPPAAWKNPFRVTFSLLVAVLNATSITSNIPLFNDGSDFLVSWQVAMIGPWVMINLRKSYEKLSSSDSEVSSPWELTSVSPSRLLTESSTA